MMARPLRALARAILALVVPSHKRANYFDGPDMRSRISDDKRISPVVVDVCMTIAGSETSNEQCQGCIIY